MLALLHLGSIAVDLILSANTELNVEGTSVHADSWIQIPTGATLNLLNATNVSADQIIVENGGVLRFWHGCASCSGGTYNWALLNSSGVVASIVNNVDVRSGGVIEGAGLTIQAGAFSIEEGGITTADGVGYPSDYGPEGLCNVASCSCQCVGAGGGSSHARSGGGGYGGAGGNGAGWDVVGQAELAPAKHTRVLPTKPQPRAPPPKPLPPSLPPTGPSPPPPRAPPQLLRSAPRARLPQQHGRRLGYILDYIDTPGLFVFTSGGYCPMRNAAGDEANTVAAAEETFGWQQCKTLNQEECGAATRGGYSGALAQPSFSDGWTYYPPGCLINLNGICTADISPIPTVSFNLLGGHSTISAAAGHYLHWKGVICSCPLPPPSGGQGSHF